MRRIRYQAPLLLVLLLLGLSLDTTGAFFSSTSPKKRSWRSEDNTPKLEGGLHKFINGKPVPLTKPWAAPEKPPAALLDTHPAPVVPWKEPEDLQEISPYQQHLPDCAVGYPRVTKVTEKKAILCPMFRDEQGFLAEWIAYYKLHGFDHIMLFDDGSADGYRDEVLPWVTSGFVSVRGNWTMDSLEMNPAAAKGEFKRAMTTKALLERECKLQAQAWNYTYFVSLDIDEYLIVNDEPDQAGYPLSIVDALDRWYTAADGRGMLCIDKNNFASTVCYIVCVDRPCGVTCHAFSMLTPPLPTHTHTYRIPSATPAGARQLAAD